MTATVARPALSACLELLKPVTWFAPMWAFSCGVVSSGLGGNGRWHLIVAGILLTGPLVCGTSQAINDWYDRHVDAINEPNRPIPSGRIPGDWGFRIAVMLDRAVARRRHHPRPLGLCRDGAGADPRLDLFARRRCG